jgi:hypothetical protein
MDFVNELEVAVRERGVRVEERIVIIGTLREAFKAGADPVETVSRLRARALEEVAKAAEGLLGRARS